MGQFEDFLLFSLVVEHEGIGKAAEVLNIAKSAASRRLKLLEDRFETRLIERGAGQWHVTASGRALYERISPMVEDMQDVNEEFTSIGHVLKGKLRVSVPEIFGVNYLLPVLLSFREQYPEIDLELDFDDRLVDLSAENYDLVVRISPDTQDVDEVQSLGITRHIIVASHSYLKESALIDGPNALKDHKILHYGSNSRCTWRFTGKGGAQNISFRPYFKSNNGYALLEAAKRGMGVLRTPDFLAKDALASGALEHILKDYDSEHYNIVLIKHPSKRINARMRVFINALRDGCVEIEPNI